MLKLLLGEHVSPSMADGLCRRHRSLAVVCMVEWEDGEFLGAPDWVYLQQAAAQGLTLVTYDRRTIPPSLKDWAEEGREHGGVIFIDERTISPADIGGPCACLEHVSGTGREVGLDQSGLLLAPVNGRRDHLRLRSSAGARLINQADIRRCGQKSHFSPRLNISISFAAIIFGLAAS